MKLTSLTKVLGILVLASAPAMASIPSEVDIRLGGAELLSPYHYAALEGSTVSLAVHAEPGALIWVYAVALKDSGEADYSFMLTLLIDRDCLSGLLSADIAIPAGLGGLKFQIEALAIPDQGTPEMGVAVVEIIRRAGDPANRADAVTGDSELLEE